MRQSMILAVLVFLIPCTLLAAEQRQPRVLIIGDSISLGYAPFVIKALEGKAVVEHNRKPDNAGDTRIGLRNIDNWLGDTQWDVVHFNWGLWDICHRIEGRRDLAGPITATPEEYEERLTKLVERLSRTGATLIWAPITYVQGGWGRVKGDEIRYNEIAERVMKKYHVTINDIHALTMTFPPELFKSAEDVHFTTEGSRRIAEQVTGSIMEALIKEDNVTVAKSGQIQVGGDTRLEECFLAPPESARPWVYWYWMNGNVTREGIAYDIQAMAEAGLGGAYLMPIGRANKSTKVTPAVDSLSDAWWELVVYAIREAERRGLRIAMNACDGWALAGGPWITPELSMQEVVWATTVVEGGKPFKGVLERPKGPKKYEEYCRDIAILAYPVPADWDRTSTSVHPKATSNIPKIDPQSLVEPGKPQALREGWVQYEFDRPFTCRSINITPSPLRAFQVHRMEVQVSDDGKTFRSLGRLQPPWHGWQDGAETGCTYSISPVTARFFRFVIDKTGTPAPSVNLRGSVGAATQGSFQADHIELSAAARINEWLGKAGFRWRRAPWTGDSCVPDDWVVPFDRVIDLSGKVDDSGVLRWTPPSGTWLVQRFGYTTTGDTNGPAGGGTGLECDKFSPDAARIQFAGWFGEALKRVGPELANKTLWMNHTDSWEAGCQNWSPAFREEFRKRRGYDPVRYLPCMTGAIIDSPDQSERFLYDLRRTVVDLVCDVFYKTTVDLTHENGCVFSTECSAPTMMSDGLQIYRDVDFAMGEFWVRTGRNLSKPTDIEDAVSGGHIYGKRVIQAEAFTLKGMHWNEDPYFLKPAGDYAFARGINRFVLHVWAHQAFPDKQPGVTLGNVGTFFSGSQTWHKPGKAWFDYLRRCQAMLQQGLPVADVCYFMGEEQPCRALLRECLEPGLSAGYDYDCINRDAILTRASARAGKLVLSDGVSYSLLVLPNSDRMTPEVARKIGELAAAGVPVLGPKPKRSYSLTNYPGCDEELHHTVAASWGSVRSDVSPDALLQNAGLSADVEFAGVDMALVHRGEMEYSSPSFCWNHRETDDADIYFMSNQELKGRSVDVAFRVTGKQPELWHPETGSIRDLPDWTVRDGRTYIPLRFEPAESYFIVFRKPAASPSSDRTGSGQGTETAPKRNFPEYEEIGKIDGAWNVAFQAGYGAPESIELPQLKSLSEQEDFGIRHFSGTATYRKTFTLAEVLGGSSRTDNRNERLYLDLGRVANLAEVTLNDRDCGVLWTPPFIVDVTGVLKDGRNTLEIKVTNTWRNRLIGDASVPAEERAGWTLSDTPWFKPDTALEPAGLIGPVTILTVTGRTSK